MSKINKFSCTLCKSASDGLLLNSSDEFVCLMCCENKNNVEFKKFFSCPLKELENCDSSEEIENLILHIQEYHKSYVLETDNFEYRITVDLLNRKNLILQLFITKLHRFLLILSTNTQGLQYNIYAEKRNYNFVLKSSITTTIERIKSTIPLEKLYDNLQNGKFTEKMCFKTLKTDGKLALNFSIIIDEYETIEKFISQNTECPICNASMKRPVYQCLKGHSVCCKCKLQISSCPTCRSAIGDTRNYLIENLTANFIYSCSYRQKGCNVTEIGDKITEHEAQCKFRTYLCPLDKNHCEELSYNDILRHFEKYHNNDFITNLIYEKNIADFYTTSNIQQKYIFAFNLLFRFSYKFKYNEFLFSVELVGSHCCPEKFNYKISFSDSHFKFTQKISCIGEIEKSKFEEKASKVCASKLYSLMPTLNRLPNAVFRAIVIKKQEF